MKLFIFCFILSWSSHAFIQAYCFKKVTDVNSVKSHLSSLLAPKDKVNVVSNCLHVTTEPIRINLYRKIISMKYKVISDYQINDDGTVTQSFPSSSEMCRIETLKIIHSKDKRNDVQVGRQNKLSQTDGKGEEVIKGSMMLTVGLPSVLNVDQENIELTCSRLANNNYQLRFRLSSTIQRDFQGRIIGKNSSSSIDSTVNVTKGQKINVGSIVKDLKNKNKNVSINNGLKLSKTKGKKTIDYYLTIR